MATIKPIALEHDTKLIIMSDMHRGDGTGSDDFAHNSLVYKCALDYYLKEGFTYIVPERKVNMANTNG